MGKKGEEGAKGKVIIFSAPSGSGKSTVIKSLKDNGNIPFAFSVSATNRPPRDGEVNGKDYYFLTDEEFKNHLENNDFIEFCEVYPGRFYGTLKSEIVEKCGNGGNVVLDVDVEGGLNIKRIFGKDSLSIFIMPPSIDELGRRLKKRGTDSEDKIQERISRAAYEISLSDRFDTIIKNEDIDRAVDEAEKAIKDFIGG